MITSSMSHMDHQVISSLAVFKSSMLCAIIYVHDIQVELVALDTVLMAFRSPKVLLWYPEQSEGTLSA